MGYKQKLRELRKAAKDIATEAYKTTNKNVEVKTVKGDKLVLVDGKYVFEDLPKVVFNTVLHPDCARAIYKAAKKELRG